MDQATFHGDIPSYKPYKTNEPIDLYGFRWIYMDPLGEMPWKEIMGLNYMIYRIYPLVNIEKTIEHHHFQWTIPV